MTFDVWPARSEVPPASTDYLGYMRQTRLAFVAAGVASLFFACIAVLRAVADNHTASAWAEWAISAAYVVGGAIVLVGLFMVAIWVPAAIRSLRLRRAIPNASFFVVKLIPGFRDRLVAVCPRRSLAKLWQNSVLSVDRDSATLWRGMFRPKKIAALPMSSLLRIETDRAEATPFRRRIIVMTFLVDDAEQELPVALRTLASLGYGRLSDVAQVELVARLMAMTEAAETRGR